MSTFHTALRRTFGVALVACSAGALAAPWTTIGSAGVVDDADAGLVDFANGEARMLAAAPAGSVLNLRYNIVALDGFQGLNQVAWLARFRDNGNGARVRLILRQYNTNGTTSTIDTFDSNDFAASATYQTRIVCTAATWDFENGPFYIEAELTKSDGSGQPALGLIELTNANCTP